MTKKLKLKVRKFEGLIPTFAEVTGQKLVKGVGIKQVYDQMDFLVQYQPRINNIRFWHL